MSDMPMLLPPSRMPANSSTINRFELFERNHASSRALTDEVRLLEEEEVVLPQPVEKAVEEEQVG